jgi:CubicO group peptidase (beta-lactamase class C family)
MVRIGRMVMPGELSGMRSRLMPCCFFTSFEVRTSVGRAGLPGSVGEYGWAGNAGTLFWVDPAEQLIALYLVQVNDGERIALRNQFRTMTQAAITRKP